MKIGKEMYLNNLNINVESIVEEESIATKIMLEQEIEKIIKKYAISKNIVEMMAELMSILEVCEAFYLIVSIRNINLDEYVSYINYELDSYRFMDNSNNIRIKNILKTADYLIDGPYIQKERDITLPLRGSRN